MSTIFLNLLLLFGTASRAAPVTLKVEITNVKKAQGKLMIAIYKPDEKFGEGVPAISGIEEVKSIGSKTVPFDLEPGKYALALFHDLNGNGELDKNFVGLPKEPYGFSKDFRPKFSAPSFEDCAFEVTGTGSQQISVKLTN
ncbi:DUF2141 domain-containing protein [Dyadobacter sp. CY312]|uniref:DUF2141 domain-containing protein n=1 Tax=Dyadobacter sp. CY312 TaxID=2907303 RepID=UPI001F22DDCF|nr:DUF2141 domain-containing protein [Dyadobacter sp. CY312]MCE7041150.1 DUF2141 domain-containing protein [Dyadobacter sp. CY312]